MSDGSDPEFVGVRCKVSPMTYDKLPYCRLPLIVQHGRLLGSTITPKTQPTGTWTATALPTHKVIRFAQTSHGPLRAT
jgi:hypothetical protein